MHGFDDERLIFGAANVRHSRGSRRQGNLGPTGSLYMSFRYLGVEVVLKRDIRKRDREQKTTKLSVGDPGIKPDFVHGDIVLDWR